MKTRQLIALFLFLACSVRASLTGDVNGDGAVNVADLIRAQRIASGGLAFEAAADLDGDSAVTEVDLFLIKEAVMGRPVQQRVASASVTSAGATLADGNITVTIAPVSGAPQPVALFRCSSEALDEELDLEQIYLLTGLCSNTVEVVYDPCGTDTGLAIGGFVQRYEALEPAWHWEILPGNRFVRNGNEIRCALTSAQTNDMAVTHSLKFATVTAEPPPAAPLDMRVLSSPDRLPLSEPGTRFAGYFYTGWISPKFEVYTRHWGTVSYTDLEAVCTHLYDVYDAITNIFQNVDLSALFPKTVYVVKDLKVGGTPAQGSFNSLTGTLEVDKGAISDAAKMKATVGHELMHAVLGLHGRGDTLAFESMEDGITCWFESIAKGDATPTAPNLYTERLVLPLKSLFRPKNNGFFGRDFAPHQDQGYGNSAFIFYHFENHRSWIKELAETVKAGSSMEAALNTLFKEKYGTFNGLGPQYRNFARDYLLLTTNNYSSFMFSLPTQIFDAELSNPNISSMYKKYAIKTQTTNLWEEQTAHLKVKEYGSGILQWEIFKPERIFAPHTKLRVKAHDGKGLDLMMHYKPAAGGGDVKSELVTGTLVEDDDGVHWESVITLATNVFSSERVGTLILTALVTAENEGDAYNYNETQDFTLTYQFEGDYFMPMQEDFISYTDLSSATTYYENQIYADAIFRIVDPTQTSGLEHFSVTRDAIGFSEPDYNYSVRTAFSIPVASRKTVDVFQIRLFSNVTVPELPPFTINIDPSGYTPWTHDGQTPVIAADGSPQMELMVYHYPPSAIDQVFPGEPAYRTQHTITSVYELKQSEDGESGGILIDVPAQITDYSCVIYLFASETGEALGPLAFVMAISPKPEETP